jgi:hypothetical protein
MKEAYKNVEAFVKILLLPLLGLFVWVGLVTGFTKLTSTDALLVVLLFSVWYCTRDVVGHMSTIELYLARIAMQQAGATRLEVISTPEGVRGTVISTGDVPTITDPREPKRK